MDSVDEKTTVGELAGRCPRTRHVFEEHGIDYCCGGKHSLEQAAKKGGIAVGDLMEAVKNALEMPPSPGESEKDWHASTLTELIDHIEGRHHTFMKEQLPRLGGFLARVLKAHGPRHGEMLQALQKIYGALRTELEEHLSKEEQILFPLIRQMDAFARGEGPEPVAQCGTVRNPIRQMEHEHDNAGAAVSRIRELTSDYTLPGDACNTFAALYDGLKAMEADLHEHIHLENNILFPRAVELEQSGRE